MKQRIGNVVCVVVARGGSTNPPRKNLLPVLGIPCVERVVLQVKQWREDVPVVVTTDDDEIKTSCRRAGAEIIHRPPELATADSEVKYSLYHACETMKDWGWSPEMILLREGNTVVIDPMMFSQAIDLLMHSDADSVLPVVTDDSFDPHLLVEHDKHGFIISPFINATDVSGNRQGRGQYHRIWYGAECFRPRNFVRYPDRGPWWYMGQTICGLATTKTSAVHIDSRTDHEWAEFLLSRCIAKSEDGNSAAEVIVATH